MSGEVRPRAGRLLRVDGTELDLRFVPTEEPGMFLAVTVDGEPPELLEGDRLHVDVLGPGQSVTLHLPR